MMRLPAAHTRDDVIAGQLWRAPRTDSRMDVNCLMSRKVQCSTANQKALLAANQRKKKKKVFYIFSIF